MSQVLRSRSARITDFLQAVAEKLEYLLNHPAYIGFLYIHPMASFPHPNAGLRMAEEERAIARLPAHLLDATEFELPASTYHKCESSPTLYATAMWLPSR